MLNLATRGGISVLVFVCALFTGNGRYLVGEALTAPSHCDQNVKVESVELYNYLGNVSFNVPKDFDGVWTLDLQTSGPFTFIGGWGIRIHTGDVAPLTHATITSAEPVQLKRGDLITFRYRVYWESCASMPVVIGLNWENHIICDVRSANEVSGEFYDKNRALTLA